MSPRWVQLLRPLRKHFQHRHQQLVDIEIREIEHVTRAVDAGQGVLIAPNHSGHAYVLYDAADRVGRPFYFMTAWQVIGLAPPVRRWILRRHGCFSVNREGTDLKAFRQATEILQQRPHPLVVFPEGEVYHTNERVTPFREGPASMALTAARRGDRPIVCVPCAIRYHYLEDPTPALLDVMARLEKALFWRVRDDLPLETRIYRTGEAILALKELEYRGSTFKGPLPERLAELADEILANMESDYNVDSREATIPERVKALRQKVIQDRERRVEDGNDITNCDIQLEDLYFVIQSFSYPGDYVTESPSLERLAETLDKFEEDILGSQTATIRGKRCATVTFGAPIEVSSDKTKDGASTLSRLLEQRVQQLLDETPTPANAVSAR